VEVNSQKFYLECSQEVIEITKKYTREQLETKISKLTIQEIKIPTWNNTKNNERNNLNNKSK